MKDYYGIGNNEYNYFRTNDNGKTWDLITDGNGDVINNGPRIIIYGKNNNGLKYTDDNFATIENSNIMDGSWEAVNPKKGDYFTNSMKSVYASSLDGRGIYVTNDNGETWTLFSAGKGDKIDNDKIHGKGDVIDNGKYYPDSETDGVNIIQMMIDGYGVEYCLMYILNDIIIPKLTNMLTNQSKFSFFNNLFNNESNTYPSFYTDGELYKTYNKGIDFAYDVGMKPLTIEDLQDYNLAKKELESPEVMDEDLLMNLLQDDNSKLYKTFRIVERTLEVHKKYILNKTLNSIADKKENYDGIEKPEDKETMSMFYEIQKGAHASVMGTIINSAFTFSNSKKIALLRTSIIETARQLKDSANLNLNIIQDKINSSFYTDEELLNDKWLNSLFIYDLRKEWFKALNNSIKDYYYQITNNIKNISKDDDHELISIASDKYNDNREELIKRAVDILFNLKIEIPSYLNDIQTKIKSEVTKLINNIQVIIDRNDNNLKKDLLEVISNYKVFEDNEMKKIEEQYLYFTNDVADYFYTKIIDMNTKDISFTKEDYYEDLSSLDDSSLDRAYDYFNQIMDEFKKRCYKLMLITNKNVINDFLEAIKISSELNSYADRLIAAHNNKEDLIKFQEKNNLKYFEDKCDSNNNILPMLIKNYWMGKRGVI